MKKLISKVIPLVILCGLIICCPSLTKTASAGPAKTVSSYNIDSYVVGSYLFEPSAVVNFNKKYFPILVETHQIGYGDTVLKLDGVTLSPSEYSEDGREPIIDPSNPSSRVVVGWNIVWCINPSSSKLYNGTHNLRAICNGINGNTISDGISFNIQD